MQEFDFVVPGKPIPQGSKRWLPNGQMKEANPSLRPWRATVTGTVMEAIASTEGFEKFTGPVRLNCVFVFTRPKGHYGTGRNEGKVKPNAPHYVSTVPDLDKIIRSLNDGITDAGLWNDDSQVVAIAASKRYGDAAGVIVNISKAAT